MPQFPPRSLQRCLPGELVPAALHARAGRIWAWEALTPGDFNSFPALLATGSAPPIANSVSGAFCSQCYNGPGAAACGNHRQERFGQGSPHIVINGPQASDPAAGSQHTAAAAAGGRSQPGPMDPAGIKATLKVLGLCLVLLCLVAAVTVSVAVMLRHWDAGRQLQGCREQAANESAALGGRLAELEQAVAELTGRLEEGARKQKQLQRQLGQARDEGRMLNATLQSCRERESTLSANVTALLRALAATQLEGSEMDTRNIALQVELTQWQGKATEQEQRLEEALQQHQASEAWRGECEARQSELQHSVRDCRAEIDALHRRLSSRATGRRCPPFWYFVKG
ncbi:coiled-coil domain-containing protein 194 isoform X2 [Pelodiscus sinensis]|uniref:coiled-coil domain-containing protein 194 isoform X2 n=1 Tax=Pelodiscus sinensis TaxID=13735 RepID=UPI003F6BB652